MDFYLLLAFCVACMCIALAHFVLRRPKTKRTPRVILIGGRGAGKTRIFLALSRKESAGQRTLPSLEAHSELVSGVLLVDTPGCSFSDKAPEEELLGDLTTEDKVVYVFSAPTAKIPPLLYSLPSKAVFIYTGESSSPPSFTTLSVRIGDLLEKSEEEAEEREGKEKSSSVDKLKKLLFAR